MAIFHHYWSDQDLARKSNHQKLSCVSRRSSTAAMVSPAKASYSSGCWLESSKGRRQRRHNKATQQSTGAYGMVQRRPAVQIRRLNDGFGDAAADASFSADTTAVQGCGRSNLHRNGGGGDTTISRTMDSAMRRLMLRSRLIRRRFMAAAALIFTGTAAEATQQSAGACNSVVGRAAAQIRRPSQNQTSSSKTNGWW